ncbi:MAG TPA: OmcA/MtrC family decaheme c-type cytochrome [Chloroflexota bacterium]|nr:OmcA/MtrC family decaheme c-type cytochrome [Chloroflexota bacterium]
MLQGVVALVLFTQPVSSVGPQAPPLASPAADVKLSITRAEIPADRKPVVTFTLTNKAGSPLKLTDVDDFSAVVPVPGVRNVRFTIGYIQTDPNSKLTSWQSYVLAPAQGQPYPFKGETRQPVIAQGTLPNILMDIGGSYRDLGGGTFSYTFATALPENYDRSATHRVGGETTRGGLDKSANATFDFVPSGGAVSTTRDVVANESCSQCHEPLALHGGLRTDTKLCVLCHTSQATDLETGNALEFNQMVHRIHYGASSPAVRAGTPYVLKGFPPEPVDFSAAVFPQFGGVSGSTIGEVRTCTVCHGAPPRAGLDRATYPAVQFPAATMSAADYAKLAPNADNYKTAPSRAACGSCHNQIDWATGSALFNGPAAVPPANARRSHPGGPQLNDNRCTACHEADSGSEFDDSVVGAHTIQARSRQLKGYKVEITNVTDLAPGNRPTVFFTARDASGAALRASDIDNLSFNIKGPTTDYTGSKTVEAANLNNLKTEADGSFSYTVNTAIPADAQGTWAVGVESRRVETIKGNEAADVTVSVNTYNEPVYVAVTDSPPVPRRQVVSTSKCNVCHGEIAFHGGSRRNTAEQCQLCHSPVNVDNPSGVPAASGGPIDAPAQSINFSLLIHRIHTGEELTRDFTIYRSQGTGIFNFDQVRFPSDRRICEKCHISGTNLLPLPATNIGTVAPREPYSPLGPAAAACLGCHDSLSAAAHGKTMTADFGEACATCHGQGREFGVAKVHARE